MAQPTKPRLMFTTVKYLQLWVMYKKGGQRKFEAGKKEKKQTLKMNEKEGELTNKFVAQKRFFFNLKMRWRREEMDR